MRKFPLLGTLIDLTQRSFRAILGLANQMIKKIALVSSWLILTPALIITLSIYLSLQKPTSNQTLVSSSIDEVALTVNNQINGQVLGAEITDFRPYIVERFLKGTPLEPHAHYIVEISDKYGLDYRLIPAIAMKESGGGATVDLASHNAWGWENGKTYFGSWEEAINTVGKTLKRGYYDKGYKTPDQIMAIYAPPQLLTGGKWAKDVNLFFSQMENL